MTRPRTPQEKVGDWYTAYVAVREEITPKLYRDELARLNATEGGFVPALSLSRLLMANDRCAAVVAALLVAQGIKPVSVDMPDDREGAD